jgi:hypothetical protein
MFFPASVLDVDVASVYSVFDLPAGAGLKLTAES